MGKIKMDDSADSSNEVSDDFSGTSDEYDLPAKKPKKSKHAAFHKKKKFKDKKKHKKKSKKHRRYSSSSQDASSESEEEWVERAPEIKRNLRDSAEVENNPNPEESLKKPKLNFSPDRAFSVAESEEWMDFGRTLPTYSNDSKKSEKRKQREQEREQNSIDRLGQHVNELNPYWKDGGTGLPGAGPSTSKKEDCPTAVIGDGGLNYLRKAFIRAKEQAKEEGRSLEDIVSQRWGSLEKFLGMLEEAERKTKEHKKEVTDERRGQGSSRFLRPSRGSDDEDQGNRHSRHSSSRHHRREGRRSREREFSSGWKKKRNSPEPKSVTARPSPITRRDSEEKSMKPATAPAKADSYPSVTTTGYRKESHKIASAPKSSSAESDPEIVMEKSTPKILSDKEMNELNSKLFKAEMLGNNSLVEELKSKISQAQCAREDFIKNGGDISSQNSSTKVVTKIIMDSSGSKTQRRKDKIVETHKDGQRVRYFPDDDKYTLKNMFQKEKLNTATDENALFARLAGKGAKVGSDYDVDDAFTDKASSSKQSSKEQEREIRDVLEKEKYYNKVLDSCSWCFDGNAVDKHLVVSVAQKCYICVPSFQSLTEGHCLIVPMSHVSCATDLDEDVWSEMQKFRKALVRMFREADQDMVIFETAMFLKRHPHMYLECIPMPRETGELAPIYFKKAIQECETEWSQNKKLVDLRNRDVRRAIPKGLPYFSVDFGDDSCGFAHVIEDEKNFPKNFAHEIIGGMLELDHHLWRKQKKDDFKTQRTKVMEFLKLWEPYDWTRESDTQ